MADIYQPRTWVDGELLNASNSANRWETGLESLDVVVDDHEDRLAALEAGSVPTVGAKALYGPSANRPQPAHGTIYFDTDLGRYIGGYGTEWRNLDGTALTTGGGDPEPGTGTAPTGMTAVVNPDNSIQLTWNPVTSATHYKLYEIRSPSGVSGADNITTTSSLRTPSTMGNYEYWVTAFVDGVESSQSNHATCTLPYGSEPGGGDPAGSPAELLDIGSSGGYWNLGIGYPSGHVDKTPQQLLAGFSEAPYFYVTSDGLRVHFQVPMNGGRTSTNTKYPRSELREYKSDNTTKASWSGSSGTHIMSGVTRVIHMAPEKQEMVVAQIHDGSDDTLQIRVEGTTWRASINGTEHATVLGTFSWGTDVAWEIRVASGTLTIKINGTTKITTNPGYGSGQYFKVGCYAQQNSTDQDNDPTDYASCELRDLVVSHS